jgi:hypothetical protein
VGGVRSQKKPEAASEFSSRRATALLVQSKLPVLSRLFPAFRTHGPYPVRATRRHSSQKTRYAQASLADFGGQAITTHLGHHEDITANLIWSRPIKPTPWAFPVVESRITLSSRLRRLTCITLCYHHTATGPMSVSRFDATRHFSMRTLNSNV